MDFALRWQVFEFGHLGFAMSPGGFLDTNMLVLDCVVGLLQYVGVLDQCFGGLDLYEAQMHRDLHCCRI